MTPIDVLDVSVEVPRRSPVLREASEKLSAARNSLLAARSLTLCSADSSESLPSRGICLLVRENTTFIAFIHHPRHRHRLDRLGAPIISSRHRCDTVCQSVGINRFDTFCWISSKCLYRRTCVVNKAWRLEVSRLSDMISRYNVDYGVV